MNIDKLKQLEKEFLHVYPDGFDSEAMQEGARKHKIGPTAKFFEQALSETSLESGLDAIEDVVKCITKSSMVSVFEKVRFKDLIKGISKDEKFFLLDAIYENVHGDEEKGFNMMIELLSKYKLAKWPILTVFRTYMNLDHDVLIKPTTVKKVIKHLELDLTYSPSPTYAFYNKYREYINEMKKHVAKSLQPNNPAFSGFLMITIN